MSDDILTTGMIDRELAAIAAEHKRAITRWTPELDALLIRAREVHKLTWPVLGQWWFDRHDWGCGKSLNDRYKKIKGQP